MRCRLRWKFLKTSSNRIIKTLPTFASVRNLSSSIGCVIDKPQKPFAAKHSKERPEICTTILIPQIVQSTLLNCPSDLIALSFFLWCARQPHYFHDRAAFDYMVNVVTRLTQRFYTVEGVIKQLESVGFVTKPQTLLLLLRIYWHGGTYDLVFEAFEEMFKRGYVPNTYARNIVMDVLFKIGRVNVALRVLRETEVPNFLTFSIAICNLCRLNDLNNVQDLLRNMLRRGYYLNSETFSMVLNCCCKLGRLAEALQVLGLMITLGVPTSVNAWSILIHGFCKSGRLVMASYLLDKMVEAGCSPNVVTCTSLIKGYLESQMPEKALGILNTLESKGCSPDLVLCNVLIHSLSKMGRCDDALDVFFSLPKRELLPDSYTFCSVISTVCLSRQYALLPKLVGGLDIQADLVVCNSIISYFCKAGYPSGAVEFYNDMIGRGFIPDGYSYVGLLSGLCRAGRIGEAVNVYLGIVKTHFGLDAHVHTIIINELIKSGNFHRAITLFRKAAAEKYSLDVVSYTVAINGLLRGGRSGEAYALYIQMKEVGIVPNENTYNVMLSGFCRERDVKMVEQILREMIDAGIVLADDSVNMIKGLMFKSCHSYSIYHLIIEFWESGLMTNEAIRALVVDGLAHGVNVGNTHLSLLNGNMGDILDVGESSSEDLSEVAASVG